MDESVEVLDLDYLRFKVLALAKSQLSSIKTKNRQHGALQKWQEVQILAFHRILIETLSDFATAYRKKRIATVAWLTRNLLELSVWIEYCTLSDENALSFRNDTFKDTYGLARSMEQIDLLQYTHFKDLMVRSAEHFFDSTERRKQVAGVKRDFAQLISRLDNLEPIIAEDTLAAMAAAIGEEAIRDNHLKVAEVATSIGRGHVFAKLNKTLSKFAHPTSLLTHLPREVYPLNFFLDDTVFLAMECLFLIEAFSAKKFPKQAAQ